MKRIQITQTGQLHTTMYGSTEIDGFSLSSAIQDAIKDAVGEDKHGYECCAAVTVTIDILTEPLKVVHLDVDTALTPNDR